MMKRAALMGVSVSSLAADLLETIDRDDLYNAVLDRDDTHAPTIDPMEPLDIDPHAPSIAVD